MQCRDKLDYSAKSDLIFEFCINVNILTLLFRSDYCNIEPIYKITFCCF